MSARIRRDRRRAGVKVLLGARDEALLRALARFRLAAADDLLRLFFAGRHRDVGVSRLRKLYDAGYIDAHLADRAAPNLYSLGPEGKAWLHARGEAVHSPPRQPWQHHLGVISVWSRLAAAVHQIDAMRLLQFIPEFEVRQRGIGAHLGVVPDALAEILCARDKAAEPVRLLIEVDRGNESFGVIRQKLRTLTGAQVEGALLPEWSAFTLVVALDAAGAKREESIRGLLAEAWAGNWRVWTEETDLAAELIQLAQPSEATVTDSRCGNGMLAAATATGGMPSGVTGGGLSDD